MFIYCGIVEGEEKCHPQGPASGPQVHQEIHTYQQRLGSTSEQTRGQFPEVNQPPTSNSPTNHVHLETAQIFDQPHHNELVKFSAAIAKPAMSFYE